MHIKHIFLFLLAAQTTVYCAEEKDFQVPQYGEPALLELLDDRENYDTGIGGTATLRTLGAFLDLFQKTSLIKNTYRGGVIQVGTEYLQLQPPFFQELTQYLQKHLTSSAAVEHFQKKEIDGKKFTTKVFRTIDFSETGTDITAKFSVGLQRQLQKNINQSDLVSINNLQDFSVYIPGLKESPSCPPGFPLSVIILKNVTSIPVTGQRKTSIDLSRRNTDYRFTYSSIHGESYSIKNNKRCIDAHMTGTFIQDLCEMMLCLPPKTTNAALQANSILTQQEKTPTETDHSVRQSQTDFYTDTSIQTEPKTYADVSIQTDDDSTKAVDPDAPIETEPKTYADASIKKDSETQTEPVSLVPLLRRIFPTRKATFIGATAGTGLAFVGLCAALRYCNRSNPLDAFFNNTGKILNTGTTKTAALISLLPGAQKTGTFLYATFDHWFPKKI